MSSNICLGEIQYLATHHVFRDREVQNILDAKSNPGFPYVFAGGKKKPNTRCYRLQNRF